MAWGFTNSEADWIDAVVVEADPNDPNKYQTPTGPQEFELIPEVIKVRGAEDVLFEVKSTTWGPVMGQDKSGEISFATGSLRSRGDQSEVDGTRDLPDD